MEGNRIMIIDNSSKKTSALADVFSQEGYFPMQLQSSDAIIDQAKAKVPDLIILPVEMKGMDGIETCYELKMQPELAGTFVILLSSQKEDYAQIAGLDNGADDYIISPVQHRVLLSRVKALLKRKAAKRNYSTSELPLQIDEERYLIIKDGVEYYLPKKEFEILSLLYARPGKVFSREEIKNAIWDQSENVRGRTIDVHIRKIREKIGEGLITTIKGVGYRIDM